jgi:branched-chain amino acid transport system ATP-binding protein
MSVLLEIENLNTGYNGVSVVRGLNLQVSEGEVVALLGPNGAGKTTTLLTASGLVPIISGDIKVFGKSIKGRRPHLIAREGLAHVPEGRSLFYQLTVAENLRLGAAKGSADVQKALSYFPALEPSLDRRAGVTDIQKPGGRDANRENRECIRGVPGLDHWAEAGRERSPVEILAHPPSRVREHH